MYGYQIVKELDSRSEGYFKFKEGTLYPALHRLERSGLITGKWQTLSNKRQRRYYYITTKGQTKLSMENNLHGLSGPQQQHLYSLDRQTGS